MEPVEASAALPVAEGGGQAWLQRYSASVMQTFGTPQRVLVRGEGCHVWDADGNRYLDLLGGIATNSLGHAHPLLVAAVTAQLTTLGHVSNFFASVPQVALAERLLEVARAPEGSAVFFANSGAEANEAAFKMARRTGRPKVVSTVGAFHGRTMGALALTHKEAYRAPFEPLPGGVEFVPYGDLGALGRAVDGATAAVFLEPVQGENGVVPAPEGYLAAARRITAEHGALLVLDEVQTGIGRTGEWFAHQAPRHGGLLPDVVTLAKGLGGGIPVGAVIAFGPRNATLLGAGQHGTTFGGNPVAAAAGLAVLHAVERDGLLGNVRTVGRHLREAVTALEHPLVETVRGEGLLLGIALTRPLAAHVVQAALAAGFIVNAARPDTVRLAPPLVLTTALADTFVAALPAILDAAAAAAEQNGATP
ncbi:acetylornithine transaminase [Kineococcus sp. T13]|uniref:acetylornithine transaminase n=1 Tax=Kineococcus vitellinus TaxID=2696565 RepID=UPI0014120D92|nr:acetylornithine transaminase [Kineococcus vitellinus]